MLWSIIKIAVFIALVAGLTLGASFLLELDGGVRIYEYQPAMMHAKTLVADGVWSIVGSLNFDNRSLSLNEESSLLVQDPDIGARMEAIFHDDLRRGIEITPASFARRRRLERLKEQIAVRGARLL